MVGEVAPRSSPVETQRLSWPLAACNRHQDKLEQQVNVNPSASSGSSPASNLPHLLAGPALFAALLLAPFDGIPFETQGAMGLLGWMAWWWIFRPVHLAVTGLLPLAVAAIFGLAPMEEVASAYSQDTILLLLGANILTSVWTRWGLDRRIGLASLKGVGTDTRKQILIWFLVSAGLSGVLPNTIVAATMIPIVVAMLRSVGIEDLWDSRVGTALVIAVAWGTSAGRSRHPARWRSQSLDGRLPRGISYRSGIPFPDLDHAPRSSHRSCRASDVSCPTVLDGFGGSRPARLEGLHQE